MDNCFHKINIVPFTMKFTSYIVSVLSFFPSYRTLSHVGHSSILRRLLLHFIWLLKLVEHRLQVKKMLSIVLTFSITVLLSPLLLLLFAMVQIVRMLVRIYLRYRHPSWQFVNVSSLRCALDTHRCPGYITIFITLDGHIELIELQNYAKSFIQNQSELAPILQQCITSKFNCYMWKDAKDFDITNHIIASKGFRRNKAVTDSVLQNHISELCSKPLSRKNPPWEVVLIPLPKTGGAANCGMLFRMHHLIAEQLPMKTILLPTCMNLWGKDERIPLIGVNSATYKILVNFIELFKTQYQVLKDKSNPFNNEGEKDLTIFWILMRKLVTLCYLTIDESHKFYSRLKVQLAEKNALSRVFILIYLFPNMFLNKFGYRSIISIGIGFCWIIIYCLLAPMFLLLMFWQIMRSLFGQMHFLVFYLHCHLYKHANEKELIIMAGKELMFALIAAFIAPGVGLHEWTKAVDPIPLFQMRPWSGHRVYAWTQSVSMQLIKNISHNVNATPSDVLLASCAGILRHYFRTIGSEIPDTVSATIPLCSDNGDIKEDQGFSIIALPTGEADPIMRLQHVQQRMQEIRDNPHRYVLSVYLLRYAFNILPQPILTMVLNYFCYKFPITITNIMCESAPDVLGKNNIKNMIYWRPAQGNIGLSLTLVHYSQSVSLAVASDREVLPQPSLMTSQFSKEFHDMAMMLGLRIDNQISRSSPYGSPQSSPVRKTDSTFSELF